jgi:hypothetical protein
MGRRDTGGGGNWGGGGWSVVNAARARRCRLGTRAQEVFGLWVDWAGHSSNVSIFFSNTSTTPNFQKYKSGTSYSPLFSKLFQVVDNFKRDNFTCGKKFKFPTEFELKIWEINYI